MNPQTDNWRSQFAMLESAEEYCDFFEIDFDPCLLARNRLAVLQQFHNLLPADWGQLTFAELRCLFALAYTSLECSSAREKQLFKVFKTPVFGVPIEAIGGRNKGLICH